MKCDTDKEWCSKCSVETAVCLDEGSCDVCLMTGENKHLY